jgi:hypothetical protein
VKVWNELKTGTNGRLYGVRYLLEPQELQGLQSAGIIGEVSEIVGMQQVADTVIADYERQTFTACGGLVQ